MHKRSFLFLLIVLLYPLALAEPQIRVMIDEANTASTVSMYDAHNIYLDGQFWYSQPSGASQSVQAIANQVYLGGQAVGRELMFEPIGQLFPWGSKQYRGSLRLIAEDNTLKIINVVDIEVYLQGVIPVEMKADWHLEALKAQAVAARTYVLAHLAPNKTHDVCATQGCQRYDGFSAEHPQANQAVQATQGVVVMYQGDYAETYYHADSGGVIASSQEVWGNALPYLVAHNDYSHETPHRNWTVTLEPNVLTASLNSLGKSVGQVSALRVVRMGASGRVMELEVRGSAGVTTLSGKLLRELLRSWGLKSTYFYMSASLSVVGNGYGHGVGMSQYGANALAVSGHEYTQILGFYYPSTELQRLAYAVASTGQ